MIPHHCRKAELGWGKEGVGGTEQLFLKHIRPNTIDVSILS
jgi:hypothetical protein